MERPRFDPELLDLRKPFEIDDGNRPHLAKHSPYTDTDLMEAWNDPNLLFAEAAADRSRRLDPRRTRTPRWVAAVPPLGIYAASNAQRQLYEEQMR